MTDCLDYDREALARMLRSLLSAPEAKRGDTVAALVKLWIEERGFLAALEARLAPHEPPTGDS